MYCERGFNAGFSNTLEEQMELEAKLQAEAGETHDYNEGVQAFLEKRKPEFKVRVLHDFTDYATFM
ncbi:MAG: enoyl-CoA hydratase-related protein, partial [Planctomycetota bacterium]|nr:enoyl-CoA hydratase-related protein [Planctomycetota bacterium]